MNESLHRVCASASEITAELGLYVGLLRRPGVVIPAEVAERIFPVVDALRKSSLDFLAAKGPGDDWHTKTTVIVNRLYAYVESKEAGYSISSLFSVRPDSPKWLRDMVADAYLDFARDCAALAESQEYAISAELVLPVVEAEAEPVKDAKPINPGDISQVLLAIGDENAAKVMFVVNSKELDVEQKLVAISALDERYYAWKSPKLGELLGVTAGRIRQTIWWKETRIAWLADHRDLSDSVSDD